MNQNKKDNSLAKTYREVGPYLGLGFQLAATILLMLYIGWLLDDYFGTQPWLTIIFSFFGGSAGIYNVIKSTINLNKKKNS